MECQRPLSPLLLLKSITRTVYSHVFSGSSPKQPVVGDLGGGSPLTRAFAGLNGLGRPLTSRFLQAHD
jgi:hypothetical protein